MGETDVDALARYIVANDSYVHAHFDAYENDKRYSITIIYSDDDYKVEKFAYDVIVFKQDKEELSEVGEAGSIYSTKEGVFVYVNGDYQQLGTSNDFNWEPIKK